MSMPEINKIIIKCPECRRKLRLPLFRSKKLKIKCPKCNTGFIFDCRKYRIKQAAIKISIVLICAIILIADGGMPFFLMSKIDMNADSFKINKDQNIEKMNVEYCSELNALEEEYKKTIMGIDKEELRQEASDYYAKIWMERANYNNRYAITVREKVQLEMLALARDSTKTIEEIVESIAVMAAPNNSDVNAHTITSGLVLDINFDMSEVTTGEEGAKTKHANKDSLKKETIRLISKVTTDVYEFCRGLDLETIYIGCKHFVSFDYRDGSSSDENIVIYKVRLDRKKIKNLEHNPFLDLYSVTQYLEVEEDGFQNLYLKDMS